MEFDIQTHLTEMETRIRADIADAGAAARREAEEARRAASEARAVADSAVLSHATLNGRVTNLEEKASWLSAGIGTLFLAALGFVWRIVTGRA